MPHDAQSQNTRLQIDCKEAAIHTRPAPACNFAGFLRMQTPTSSTLGRGWRTLESFGSSFMMLLSITKRPRAFS